MPADTENERNFDEIKRLLARGLIMNTAKEVAVGKRDEAFEVARADEERTLRTWCRGKKNIPTALKAVWDLTPEKFYLALDGAYPGDHASAAFVIIEADIDEVNRRLTTAASRDKGPWHTQYKRKSCGIAYRWLQGTAVTPPLLREVQGQIHIEGGMHRFHLARHYGTARMPFLVQEAELAAVLALIPSAALGAVHTEN